MLTLTIIEGDGAPFVDRFLRDKNDFTAEQMKALFVNHNDGSELDLMDTDSVEFTYTKVVDKKLKLKRSPLEGTSIDHVAVNFGMGKFVSIVTFIKHLHTIFELVDLGGWRVARRLCTTELCSR